MLPLVNAIRSYNSKMIFILKIGKTNSINDNGFMFAPYSLRKSEFITLAELEVLLSIARNETKEEYIKRKKIKMKTYYAHRASMLRKLQLTKHSLFSFLS